MVLKELIFDSFLLWESCGGLDRTGFLTVSNVGRVQWS